MNLSEEFMNRVNNTTNVYVLKEEIEAINQTLLGEYINYSIRRELFDKMYYLQNRIETLENNK